MQDNSGPHILAINTSPVQRPLFIRMRNDRLVWTRQRETALLFRSFADAERFAAQTFTRVRGYARPFPFFTAAEEDMA